MATSVLEQAHVAKRSTLVEWLTTVDHKKIGILYGASAFLFFLIGGIEALIIRAQLARPDATLVSPDVLQPAVHDARHDDDLPRRHAAQRDVLQLLHPAA